MEETGVLENRALLSSLLPRFEPGPKLGLVQNRPFSGNSTHGERALTTQGSQRVASTIGSGAAEAGVAEHFQPMGVRLSGQ
jgi:hypothetical protein